MTAQELFSHISANPSVLFVRTYVDLTDRRMTIDSEFLLRESAAESGPTVCSFHGTSSFGEDPYFRQGIWSDMVFTRRHLFPRLEAHAQWLASDQIVIVARLSDGSEIVARQLGRLTSQYLLHASTTFAVGSTVRRRLVAIVYESNRSKTDLELLA